MKAATRLNYGPPASLIIQQVEKPVPKKNEVLVRVHATTVSRTDCAILTGKPFLMRLFTGLFKPRLTITGTDFAGEVEATGANVKSFKAGDRIMGFGDMGLKSHAQYLSVSDTKAILPMPASLTYEQAAACLEGAFYALTAINAVKPKPGQTAMIIGATGAIGSAFVQLFKYYENEITAVCKAEHSQLVRSLGATKIIDYMTEDFTKDTSKYDFIFDAVEKSSFVNCKSLLKERGIYSSTGGLQNILLAISTPLVRKKKVIFAIPKDTKQSLSFIKELIEKNKFVPVIDRRYPLDKIAEAFTYVASGQKIGNVIITMDN